MKTTPQNDDSKAENNKAIALKAFDTLFNTRDYTAAERFWSPNQISTGDEMGNIIDRFQNIVFETVFKQKKKI
jgi:hypothetical protein